MNLRRSALCLLLVTFAGAAAAQSLLRAKYDTGTASTSMIHTQARFLYAGKNMGTVNNATAVLFDATDPERYSEAKTINSGRFSVTQAQKVCTARVPGKVGTVGLGGDINFDYVLRGNYSVLVCTQVKFRGITKPVWVAGVESIGSEDFSRSTQQIFTLPKPVQIVIDPYAKELKAKPLRLNLPPPAESPHPLSFLCKD
jgi:hypothetical protein